MKTPTNSERLLADVLCEDDALATQTLATLVREVQRHRVRRGQRTMAGVVATTLSVLFAVWGFRPTTGRFQSRNVETEFASVEVVHSQPLTGEMWIHSQSITPRTIESQPGISVLSTVPIQAVPRIDDRELLGLFPDYPVALVRPVDGTPATLVLVRNLEEATSHP
jgi:hypothetical protein